MDQLLNVEVLKQIDYGSKLENASRKSPGSTSSPSHLAESSHISRKSSEFLTPTREHQGTKTRRLKTEIEAAKNPVSPGTCFWILIKSCSQLLFKFRRVV